jgi:hypothetical protein
MRYVSDGGYGEIMVQVSSVRSPGHSSCAEDGVTPMASGVSHSWKAYVLVLGVDQ